jgi:hypothetical protein
VAVVSGEKCLILDRIKKFWNKIFKYYGADDAGFLLEHCSRWANFRNSLRD